MPFSDIPPIQVYLDHNASTPLAPEVICAMQPYLDAAYGNPSSAHWAAQQAAQGMDKAREQVATLIGCCTDEVIFTGGATEANNMALKGVWFDRRRSGKHIITSSIEHPAIRAPLRFLKTLGAKITVVPVDRYGRVDPEHVRKAICSDTTLISIMHANNETGVIQPLAEIGEIAREHGVLFHTDAAQSVGKISVKVDQLGVDMLSIAGHKFYGPKGVGALYVKGGLKLIPHMHGAGHESGRRAGTENVLQIAGLGAACELASAADNTHTAALRDRFWQRLKSALGDKVVLNGHADHLVPNTLNVSFVGHVGAEILEALPDIAASTGSACHSGCIDMSPVLLAMRVPTPIGMGAIRFSLGHQNTVDEIDYVVSRLVQVTG